MKRGPAIGGVHPPLLKSSQIKSSQGRSRLPFLSQVKASKCMYRLDLTLSLVRNPDLVKAQVRNPDLASPG